MPYTGQGYRPSTPKKYKSPRPSSGNANRGRGYRASRGYQRATTSPARGYQRATTSPSAYAPDARQEAIIANREARWSGSMTQLPNMQYVPGVGMIPNYGTQPPPILGTAPYRPPQTAPTFYTKFGVAPYAPIYNPLSQTQNKLHTYNPLTIDINARHGYHQQVLLKQLLNSTATPSTGQEAQGVLPNPNLGGSSSGAGDGGYGGYGYGGGGYSSSDYSYSSTPFSQYRAGYAAQGSVPQQTMGVRGVRQPAVYQNAYAVQNPQSRYLSLLTNWRI